MKCKYCKTDLPSKSIYCKNCGRKIMPLSSKAENTPTCNRCGNILSDDGICCPKCGTHNVENNDYYAKITLNNFSIAHEGDKYDIDDHYFSKMMNVIAKTIDKGDFRCLGLFVCGLLLLLVYCVLSVSCNTGLFADGTNYVVGMLSQKHFTNWDLSRQIIMYMNEIFSITALNLGVKNISVITALYAFGIVVWRLLFYSMALVICLRAKNEFLMGMTVFVAALSLLFTGFFSVIESTTALAAFWLTLIYLLTFDEYRKKTTMQVFMFVVTVASTGLHESYIFFGLILIALLLYLVKRSRVKFNVYWAITLLTWASSIGLAVYFTFYSRVADNRAHYFNSFFSQNKKTIIIFALLFLVFMLSLFVKNRNIAALFKNNGTYFHRKWLYLVVMVILVLTIAAAAYAVLTDNRNIALSSYTSRVLNLIIPLAMTAWIFLVLRFEIRLPLGVYRIGAYGLTAVTVAFFLLVCPGYRNYLQNLSATCTNCQGILEFYLGNELHEGYSWRWTLPSESILAQAIYGDAGEITSVVRINGIEWEPYDSTDINQYPDLSGYGVTYSTKIRSQAVDYYDADENTCTEYVATGFYADEGKYRWLEPKACIRLYSEYYTNTNLLLRFSTLYDYDQLAAKCPDEGILVTISSNEVELETVKVMGPEINSVVIDGDLLRATDNGSGYYEISITTNTYYNPYESGDSDDDRNLTIMINYLGP